MSRKTLAIVLIYLVNGCPLMAQSVRTWWKEAIVYQIYPRSFQDSDGDGIGDLKGIIQRLDYIKSLGVDAVWLNPIYSSPNDDNGYYISDYRAIMKDFGTMEDFDTLLAGLHQRGIKLIMDLVVNHSSDEHEWFKKSRSSRTSPYRNYYHWWNAEKGKPPYRYSLFDVAHDAWKYDSLTNAYYLHYFSQKQPDLKWENPALRQEVYNIMHFWAKKGIDGFRLDAFQFAAKDTTYPGFPVGYEKDFVKYYAMQGNLHGYLQEMHREVFSKYPVMSVAEGAGNGFEDAHNLVDASRNELNMAYAFEGVDLAKPEGYSVLKFKEVFSRWDSAFANEGWLSVFLANHDQARMVSRFGNDAPAFRASSSKMLSTFIMTMRGTPYVYYGDELGMTNASFNNASEFRDVQTLNEFVYVKSRGGNETALLEKMRASSRDNGRTPFQWTAAKNAGFTSGTPWIKIAPNYTDINLAQQETDSSSCLQYFRKLVSLRKAYADALVYGRYEIMDRTNPNVYAYLRIGEKENLLVVLNFTSKTAVFNNTQGLKGASLLANNLKQAPVSSANGKRITLAPYQSLVFRFVNSN